MVLDDRWLHSSTTVVSTLNCWFWHWCIWIITLTLLESLCHVFCNNATICRILGTDATQRWEVLAALVSSLSMLNVLGITLSCSCDLDSTRWRCSMWVYLLLINHFDFLRIPMSILALTVVILATHIRFILLVSPIVCVEALVSLSTWIGWASIQMYNWVATNFRHPWPICFTLSVLLCWCQRHWWKMDTTSCVLPWWVLIHTSLKLWMVSIHLSHITSQASWRNRVELLCFVLKHRCLVSCLLRISLFGSCWCYFSSVWSNHECYISLAMRSVSGSNTTRSSTLPSWHDV